ncbi:MAG: hypothetical protein MI746_11200, partial [Pseudomonadales bacterium]|nr:hypothetical protein [Pseudomonadales bacterium]
MIGAWRTQRLGDEFDTLLPGGQLIDLVLNFSFLGLPSSFDFSTLVLREFSESCGEIDGFCVVAYQSFSEISELNDSNVRIIGGVLLDINNSSANISIDRIFNGSSLRRTGQLRIELWVTNERYSAGLLRGFKASSIQLDSIQDLDSTLGARDSIEPLSFKTEFLEPPEEFDDYVLVVAELDDTCGTVDGYCIAEHRTIGNNLPGPPTKTTASRGEYREFVEIEWNAVDVAHGYEIYRCNSSEPDSCEFLLSVEEDVTQFRDFGVGSFDTFVYGVKTCNFFGCSDFSFSNLAFTLADDLTSEFRPTYNLGVLLLPAVYVDDGSEVQFYEVELVEVPSETGLLFRLASTSQVEDPRLNGIPSFNTS